MDEKIVTAKAKELMQTAESTIDKSAGDEIHCLLVVAHINKKTRHGEVLFRLEGNIPTLCHALADAGAREKEFNSILMAEILSTLFNPSEKE